MRIAVGFARQVAKSPNSQWCAACVDVLDVSAAGITLMGLDDAGPICSSNESVAALEDLAFALGQAPCREAHQSRQPVLAPQLESASGRWPAFVDLARSSGISAAFAFPMASNGVSIGVLTVYQQHQGDLSAAQHDDCLAIAEVLAETILSLQSDEASGDLAPALDDAVGYRAEIYQASGVVAVQLSIPCAEAVLRIRGHAFSTGQPLASVAADIIAHRLWLPDDRQPQPEAEV